MNRVIDFLIFLLFLTPAISWSAQPDAVQPKELFALLAQHTPGVSAPVLHVQEEMSLEEYPAYSTASPCHIALAADFARKVDREALVGVLAHELAHCSLKHVRYAVEASRQGFVNKAWAQEYEADKLAVTIAAAAGFDIKVAYGAMLLHLGPTAGPAHPAGMDRVLAMAGGPRRMHEVTRARGIAVARSLHVDKDGRFELR